MAGSGFNGNDPYGNIDFNDFSTSFLDGATGTFDTASNGTVGFTVEENIYNAPTATGGWYFLQPGNTVRADGGSYLEVQFDSPVSGIQVLLSGSDDGEEYSVWIDGELVHLQNLVDAGLATFETAGRTDLDVNNTDPGTHELISNGSMGGAAGSNANNGSLGVVTFLYDIETIRVSGTRSASGSGTGYFDFVSIGLSDANLPPPLCFTPGALISTPDGYKAVEELVVGDMVMTLERGAQPIRWVNSRKIKAKALQDNPNLMPIRIRAGAFGNAIPNRDLLVSPQHRMLVTSKLVDRMFGNKKALVAVKHLLEIEGIEYADVNEVTYVHFLCDQHEIVFVENTPSESLYTGKQALKSIPNSSKDEIFTIFPELESSNTTHKPKPAATLVNGRNGREFASRVVRNERKLIEGPISL